MSETATIATSETTLKSNTTARRIAKTDRSTSQELRLQFSENGEYGGKKVRKGEYLRKTYASEHAVMCAQAIHNGFDQAPVNAVLCEMTAVEMVRSSEAQQEAG